MSASPASNPTPVEGAVHTADDANAALGEVLNSLWRRKVRSRHIEMRVVRVLEWLNALETGEASLRGEAE